MGVSLLFDDVKQIGVGVWEAAIEPADVGRFAGQAPRKGAYSVIGLSHTPEKLSESRILATGDGVILLNQGSSNRAIILDLGGAQADSSQPEKFGRDHYADAYSREGDSNFLRECEKHLRPEIVAIARRFLSSIRESYSGNLREGQGRKWVNYPDNFVAITIQNRDQSLAINVRGHIDNWADLSVEPKPDRPGYLRFKLSRECQIEDALRLVRASANNQK